MAGKGFEINRRGIDAFTRELQQEFDKRPIHVPVRAERGGASDVGTTTNYYGPVIHVNADGAQLAWNNQTVSQTQADAQPIASGFERLAQAVADILERLAGMELPNEDATIANDAGNEALLAVTESQPDVGRIRRAVMILKGVLAPLAIVGQSGAEAGVAEWAQHAVTGLGSLIP